MKIIQFQSLREKAFAELLVEAKQLCAQGLVMTMDDTESENPYAHKNIVPFPVKDDAPNGFDAEEDLELVRLVAERKNDREIDVDFDDL